MPIDCARYWPLTGDCAMVPLIVQFECKAFNRQEKEEQLRKRLINVIN